MSVDEFYSYETFTYACVIQRNESERQGWIVPVVVKEQRVVNVRGKIRRLFHSPSSLQHFDGPKETIKSREVQVSLLIVIVPLTDSHCGTPNQEQLSRRTWTDHVIRVRGAVPALVFVTRRFPFASVQCISYNA
jgi:hypothetical protein